MCVSEADIEEAPAADVAPVVHGRWEYCPNLGIAVCTECGFERELDSNFGRAISYPNCGAKMDEENHDGLDARNTSLNGER